MTVKEVKISIDSIYQAIENELFDYIDEYGMEYEIGIEKQEDNIEIVGECFLEEENDEVEEEFYNIIGEINEELNNYLIDLENLTSYEIDISRDYIELKLDMSVDQRKLRELETYYIDVEYELDDSDRKIKELEEKVKRLESETTSGFSEVKLYNAISNMYGFSLGIYDEDGNKICDGYNPEFEDRRIGNF
jgi:chromosome segregation ATPase